MMSEWWCSHAICCNFINSKSCFTRKYELYVLYLIIIIALLNILSVWLIWSVLLRFKQFSIATSIWKSASPQISKSLLLSAIFHLLHLQLLTADQRPFNVPDSLMSFWNAWIIVGGYGLVIKGHRALIGQRLSQFGRHAYATGNPVSQNGCESDISLAGLAGHPHKLCIVSST